MPSFLKCFPEIDVEGAGSAAASSKASNVQGITVGGYTLFFGAVATIWLGESPRNLQNIQELTVGRQYAWS